MNTSSKRPPAPCDPDIYAGGTYVGMLAGGNATIIEAIVREVARCSGQPTDWHYAGGRAVVKTAGDAAAVREALRQLGCIALHVAGGADGE